jgi:hypothetical protein
MLLARDYSTTIVRSERLHLPTYMKFQYRSQPCTSSSFASTKWCDLVCRDASRLSAAETSNSRLLLVQRIYIIWRRRVAMKRFSEDSHCPVQYSERAERTEASVSWGADPVRPKCPPVPTRRPRARTKSTGGAVGENSRPMALKRTPASSLARCHFKQRRVVLYTQSSSRAKQFPGD